MLQAVDFLVIDNNGDVVPGFRVFARESSNNNQGEWHDKGKSGEIIELPSEKKWDFYLAKRRDDDSLQTGQFTLPLDAGEEIDSTLAYKPVE